MPILFLIKILKIITFSKLKIQLEIANIKLKMTVTKKEFQPNQAKNKQEIQSYKEKT